MKDNLKGKSRIYLPVIFLFLLVGLSISCGPHKGINIVTLQEDTGFIQIPGVGWQTFGKTADEDSSIARLHFKSGCAYYRWYWVSLEPREGEYAFAMIDSLLLRCRRNNQTLAFRVMCEDPWGEGLPEWLIKKGIRRTFTPCPQEGAHWVPDMSDPTFKYYHQRLIRELGKRYDGHPDIALLDIGSVGLWGEGHIYCDSTLMPSRAIRKENTDLYYEAFPNTPLTGLVDDKPNVLYANSKGRSGWRGDCWGNGDAPGVDWNLHKNSYWPMVKLMPDGWKTGTVALEPCGTFGSYPTSPKVVVDDAISWHATFVQNKSHPIPSEWIPEIERLVKKLGFRLVLKNIVYPAKTKAGSEITVTMKWENKGIAPPYRDYRIAFRLEDNAEISRAVVVSDSSILGWLPGTKDISVSCKLPDDLPPGNYALETGLVFHSSIEHTVPVTNIGRTDDGWLRAGNVKVKGKK